MTPPKYRIFVYGTLMSGELNHRRLSSATPLGQARTALGYALHDLGPFPGLVAGQQRVTGEIYEVDATTRTELDQLEGHPRFYCRTLIRLEDGSAAEAYMLSPGQARGRPVIPSGSWRLRKDSLP